MKKHDITELNNIYTYAESVDEEVFADMRSNILLVAGQHYSKKTSSLMANLRHTNKVTDTQKLRLTKNHIHKISQHYKNAILSKVPGVTIVPKNETEMQDRKSAELNSAVWEDAKQKYRLKEKFRKFCGDFVDIGEVCVKLFFDPSEGSLKGYEPKLDEATGAAEVDEMGQPVADLSKPVFSGAFVFETVHAFNLLRSPQAQDMKDSPYWIIRKMVDKETLLKKYAGDPDKKKYVEDSSKTTYVVFDSNRTNYSPHEKEILLLEYYFRPCPQYPDGYFYIATDHGILEEGPLPFGIWPLVWEGFDEVAAHPRARSVIKVARPYQAEINRASSQLAMHQISVGDDKIIYMSGTKLSPGALLPGIRGLTYQGAPPQILPGRDGSQFLGYIDGQITEMYKACMLEEINAENSSGQMDPYTLLFRTASQQQRFSQYTEKFEQFLIDLCYLYLELAKHYLPDDELVAAIGRAEYINISEFKNTTPLSHQIKVDSQNEAIDTKMGKQLVLNQVLQYAGSSLSKEDLGKVITNMPYLSNAEIFSDWTINYEMVQNDMLALERGEFPDISPYADNNYYVSKISHRMKQADFKLLPPQVIQGYQQLLVMHEQEVARKIQEMQALKDGFIPIGGAMITCDLYVPKTDDPSKSQRVRLPYQALDWLIKKIQAQGMSIDQLEQMNQGALAEISQMTNQGGQQASPPQLMPALPQ